VTGAARPEQEGLLGLDVLVDDRHHRRAAVGHGDAVARSKRVRPLISLARALAWVLRRSDSKSTAGGGGGADGALAPIPADTPPDGPYGFMGAVGLAGDGRRVAVSFFFALLSPERLSSASL
jgi:hypothetical protein